MAEVPEDYDSGPDESQKLQFTRTKSLRSHKVHNAESDNPELLPEIDQEPEEQKPEEQKTKEDDFEEGKPGSAENVLLEPDRMPEEETEPETTQVLKLETSSGAGGEDLEVPTDEKSEESDLQPPDVSVDVLTEPPTETDTQLPTETNVPEAASSELPEETGQNVPEESLREGDKEIGPEQTTPDFPSEKPIKSVEEEDLPLPKMTKSEITEEIQEESAEEKSTEPSEVTQPEFPDQTLRQSTEEVDIQPPEEIPIKSTEQIDTEQSEQVKPQFPDKKPRQSIEEKVPEPPEELKQELSGEDARKPIDEASLELSEKATSEIPKETQRRSVEEKIPETLEEAALGLPEEIKPDVQGDTQEKSIEEKVPEPSEDRKSSGQTKVLRKSSGRSQSKTTLVESSKEKSPVLQEQTEAEIPKEKLIKSTEETGQVPPQMSKPEVQEKSQPEPTKEKNLELPDEPKPRVIDTEFPKEHRPEPSKLKSPIDRDELVYSEYHKKMSEKETNKAKDEYMVGSPRESMESAGTDGESQDLLKELQADDTSELVPTIPSSESPSELRDSFSDVVFSQRSEKMGPKDSKINKSISPQFEHLNWSPERVAEWISELGFPQYKECFTTNFISGRKLIHVNCCNLPQMGITDFEDMKTISRHTRELLGIQEPLFSRSIVLPYRDNIGLFLERKGHSGVKSDSLTFSGFIEASGLQEYSPEIEALENLSDSCQEENEASLQDNGSSEEGGAAGQGAEEKTISFSLEDQT